MRNGVYVVGVLIFIVLASIVLSSCGTDGLDGVDTQENVLLPTNENGVVEVEWQPISVPEGFDVVCRGYFVESVSDFSSQANISFSGVECFTFTPTPTPNQ